MPAARRGGRASVDVGVGAGQRCRAVGQGRSDAGGAGGAAGEGAGEDALGGVRAWKVLEVVHVVVGSERACAAATNQTRVMRV